MHNLRFAFRNLARTPLLSAVAILSLALGIGANTAMFSLLEQIILRPLPVANPGQLVNLLATGPKSGSNSTNQSGGGDSIFSNPMFRDLEKEASQPQSSWVGLAGHRGFGVNLAYKGQTASLSGNFVTGGYFPTLGVQPALGRLLSPQDDLKPGADRWVVLSHAYWTEKFNRGAEILNQSVLVNGVPMTVIGVSAAGFRGTTLGATPAVYVPMSMREALTPGWKGLENRRSYWMYVFGRIKPGVTMAKAEAEMNTRFRAIIQEVELPLQKGASEKGKKAFAEKRLLLEPGEHGQSSLTKEAETPLLLLLAITGFVLLIACANIANLLLARAANRSKEFAIRLAIGAQKSQLAGQLLSESALLAVLSGLTGLLVAYGTNQLLLATVPMGDEQLFSPNLSPTTIAFALGVSLVAGFLFGLIPAVHATKQDLADAMKDQAGSVSASASAGRLRQILVTGQIALSLLLLVSAGMFLKSLSNVMRVNLGIRVQNVVTFGLSPELNQYKPVQTQALFRRLEEKLNSLPGVDGAVVSMVPMIAGNNYGSGVSVDGFVEGPDTDTHSMFNHVGAGFFRTMGIALKQGREFSANDAANAPKVAVVNESFERKFGNGQSLLGKRMRAGGPGKNEIEIVGIARDVKYSDVKNATPPVFYRPYLQDDQLGSAAVYVATSTPVEQILPAIRSSVAELDANLPIEGLKTMKAQVEENITGDRVVSTLAAAFACLATILAAIGLYGVLAFSIARRTREIGIRLVLGAEASTIRNMVMREVGILLLIGIVIGLPAAFGMMRFAESQLYEMKGSDWTVYLAGTLLVSAVSLLAGYLPALRAMRIEPTTALRYD
jgi:putative ABC transport system permease protein